MSGDADDPGVIRSIRYSTAQWKRIEEESQRLGVPPSTFVRICSLQAVGLVQAEELAHVRRVLAIRHISKAAPAPMASTSPDGE